MLQSLLGCISNRLTIIGHKGFWKIINVIVSRVVQIMNNPEHCFKSLTLCPVVFFCSASGPSTSGESSKAMKTPMGAAMGSKRSIQEMTDKTETYKSLFTSHSSAKRSKDQLSNWVTHTPYHF